MKKLSFFIVLSLFFGVANTFAANISYTPTDDGITYGYGTSLSRINDGNTSTAGANDYQVHPMNASGKTITMTFASDVDIESATFYNRVNNPTSIGRIDGAQMIFKDTSGTDLYTYTFASSAGEVHIANPAGTIQNVKTVELTNFQNNLQNFREIAFDGSVSGPVSGLGSHTNPAPSCYRIKQQIPTASDGVYWLQNGSMTSPKKYHCDMTTNDGGWQLLFQRRGGNFNNAESCGTSTNNFLHTSCGDVGNLAYGNSYNADDVDTTIADFAPEQYMNVQFDASMVVDANDAYIIHSNQNLFPNLSTATVIPVDSICHLDGSNCDSTNVDWVYAPHGWWNSNNCGSGWNSSSSYKGMYGPCHNGSHINPTADNYNVNSFNGDRDPAGWYAQTKLWNYGSTSENYMERVFIRPTNKTPTALALSATGVAHNAPVGTDIGTLTTADPDSVDTHTYTFSCDTPGADDGKFSLSGSTLSIAEVTDYDTQSTYTVCIRTTDNGLPNLSFDQTFVIEVGLPPIQNVLINEVEYDPDLSSSTYSDNQSEWFELLNNTTNDIDLTDWTITEKSGAGTNTYTFSGDTITAGQFFVVANDTAAFQVMYPSITPDLDVPGTRYFKLSNTSDYLELRDQHGRLVDRVEWGTTTWNIDATDAPICRENHPITDTDTVADWSDECVATPGAINRTNQPPTDITLSNTTVDENVTTPATVGTLATTDPDTGDTHNYTFACTTAGADDGSFALSGSTLQITTSPDYETKHTYEVCVRTTDSGGETYDKTFTITINDINEAPVITDATFSVTEDAANGTVAGTHTGSDVDASSTLAYSITAGNDDGIFAIDATTGQITVSDNTNLDYETTTSYALAVQISDGTLTDTATVTITIIDVDDTPPATPLQAPDLQAGSDSGVLATDDITNTTTPTFDIVCTESPSTITLYSDKPSPQTVIGTHSCTAIGTGSVTASTLSQGVHHITYTETDNNGNISGHSPQLAVEIDVTDPQTLNLTINTDTPYDIDNPHISFNGTDNESGVSHYTVQIDGGATATQTSPYTPTLSPASSHTVVVTIYDVAGNSISKTMTYPPTVNIAAPTVILNQTITDTTITVSGPNPITEITANGVSYSDLVCTPNPTPATPQSGPINCTIRVNSSGVLTVSAKDTTGATGTASSTYTIETDAPVISFSQEVEGGPVQSDTIAIQVTDDNPKTTSYVYGFVNTEADCSSTNDSALTTPFVSGTTFVIDTETNNGKYICAKAEDLAGNISYQASAYPLQIDITDPTCGTEWIATPNTPTNGSVTVTLSGSSDTNSGLAPTNDYTCTVSTNGNSCTIVIEDVVGNSSTCTSSTVTHIDTTAPTGVITYSMTDWTNSPVTMTLTTNDPIQIPAGWNKISDTVYAQEVTANTSGTLVITDIAGNTANVAYEVANIDMTAPLCGSWTYSPTTPTNSAVTATLAHSTDADSGIATAGGSCTLTSNADTCTVSISDNAGNTTVCTSSTVTNIDQEKPVITLIGSATIEVVKNDNYTDAGATATDNEDGIITSAIVSVGTVDTNTLGDYTITYDVTDSAGNAATQVTRTVRVVSGDNPIISLLGNATETVEAGSSYTDAGATATDVEDGDITSSIVINNPVNATIVGTYTITYDVTDSSGNSATQITRTIKVVDTTAPAIILTGDSILTLNRGQSFIDPGAICSDNVSCTVSVQGTVNTNQASEYTLIYTAIDPSGNISQVSRIVRVEGSNNGNTNSSQGAGGGYNTNQKPVIIQEETPKTDTSIQFLPTQSKAIPDGMTPSGQKVFTIQNRVTDYVCPKIVQVYTTDEINATDIKNTDFHDDIRALIMFRGLEKDEKNLGQTFKEYQSYGINLNTHGFRPYENITRAEYVKMLVRSLSCRYTYLGKDTPYTDISETDWHAEYVKFATEQGWINGYSDGTFKPNNPITRNEAAKIFSRAIRLQTASTIANPYLDVSEGSEFLPYIKSLRESGIMKGKTGNMFSPETYIPRTEASRMIYRTFLGGDV